MFLEAAIASKMRIALLLETGAYVSQ
jgi:hypothetical protein